MDNLPEKAQANQKRKLIKVDDRYIAENYYQNSMDEVMFEKDGTISKMRQFDYKIHKYKPGKTILPENSAESGQQQQTKGNEPSKSPRSKRRKATPSTPP